VSTAPARFTLSNLGMFGVDNFVAIINPPEVAILAVGAVMPMVLPAPDGTLQARQVMQVTLSMDHRAGDGLLAARFLNCVKKHLEDPATLG
jgi:pyruvate dehydrogenase E2 component (dihydrolipoamide acetyltransferase)